MTLRVSLLSPEDLRPHGGGQRLSTEAPTILTVSSLSDDARSPDQYSPVASEHSCHCEESPRPQEQGQEHQHQHEPAGTVVREEVHEKKHDSVAIMGVVERENEKQKHQEHHHQFTNEQAHPNQVHEPPSWRPFWLQRITILFFGIFFLACVVVLTILLSTSEKNQGLGDASEKIITGHAKVWKLIPTAGMSRHKKLLEVDDVAFF